MRGATSLDYSYYMTYQQRKNAMALIEENIENTKETGVMMH